MDKYVLYEKDDFDALPENERRSIYNVSNSDQGAALPIQTINSVDFYILEVDASLAIHTTLKYMGMLSQTEYGRLVEEDTYVATAPGAMSIKIRPNEIGKRFVVNAQDSGAAEDMAVDGSSTPVEYTIDADANFDLHLGMIKIHGADSNIKFGQFMGINNKLTNGLKVEMRSDNVLTTFSTPKSTDDLKSLFSSNSGFFLDNQAGRDHVLASHDFGVTSVPIRKAGTFPTDDYIKITVQDDLTGLLDLYFTATGLKRKP